MTFCLLFPSHYFCNPIYNASLSVLALLLEYLESHLYTNIVIIAVNHNKMQFH